MCLCDIWSETESVLTQKVAESRPQIKFQSHLCHKGVSSGDSQELFGGCARRRCRLELELSFDEVVGFQRGDDHVGEPQHDEEEAGEVHGENNNVQTNKYFLWETSKKQTDKEP